MPFFTLNHIKINFNNRKLSLRIYIIAKTPPTIRWVELIGIKVFAAVIFDLEDKTFVVYIAYLTSLNPSIEIHPSCHTQITLLKANKAFIIILSKYIDFVDIFSLNFTAKLPEYIKINNLLINQVDGQQLFYKSIYSLKSVELETLKTYIETNLINSFIELFKSLINISMIIFSDVLFTKMSTT